MMNTFRPRPTHLTPLTLAAVLVTACVASQTGGSVKPNDTPEPSAPTPLSSLPATMRPPSGPPKSPTDQSPDWIAGRVTQGGNGPCYALETDDGTQYALYSTAGITLETGAIVRVRTEPLTQTVDCAPGIQLRLLEVEPVG